MGEFNNMFLFKLLFPNNHVFTEAYLQVYTHLSDMSIDILEHINLIDIRKGRSANM